MSSVRLDSYPRDKTSYGWAKYGFGISSRNRGLESGLDDHDDVTTLTGEPGVDTRVDTGKPNNFESESGIIVEQTLSQDSRRRDNT